MKSVKGMDGIFCIPKENIDIDVLNSAGSNLKVIATCSVG